MLLSLGMQEPASFGATLSQFNSIRHSSSGNRTASREPATLLQYESKSCIFTCTINSQLCKYYNTDNIHLVDLVVKLNLRDSR